MKLTCPNCGKPQYCPCPSCRERHKQKIVWKWVTTPDGPIACGHCGYTMSCDAWMDEEWKQYQEWIYKDSVCRISLKERYEDPER